MKNNKIEVEDERVKLLKNEIEARGFRWLRALLCTTMIIQGLCRVDIDQYIVEVFLVIFISIYENICYNKKGLKYDVAKEKSNLGLLVEAFVFSVISSIITVYINLTEYETIQISINFVCFFVIWFGARKHTINKYRKNQDKINKELDEE